MPAPSDKNLARLDRSIIQVITTQELRDKLEIQAAKLGQSLSGYCRVILANSIGYNLDADSDANKATDKRGRPRKYATKEDARIARNTKLKAQRVEMRQIMDDYRHQLHVATGQQILETLQRRGISLDSDSTNSTDSKTDKTE